jgi:hypothetical protein
MNMIKKKKEEDKYYIKLFFCLLAKYNTDSRGSEMGQRKYSSFIT